MNVEILLVRKLDTNFPARGLGGIDKRLVERVYKYKMFVNTELRLRKTLSLYKPMSRRRFYNTDKWKTTKER